MVFHKQFRRTRIEHDETRLNDRGLDITIHKNGQVTLRKEVSPTEEDVIEKIPASTFFKITNILRATRKSVPIEDDNK